ncbi:hypothetical protein BDN72DRAFT_864726 [Pluteus cervinus]|uniref:Uncharacterized protein n=1 Tax=Pluteus cervinus TaxID=181527 RepID=A0ACD3A2Q6_9AGAR|nr:hypothetical protein BDN72DRAFT_864726 [Pluteus cervinus]
MTSWRLIRRQERPQQPVPLRSAKFDKAKSLGSDEDSRGGGTLFVRRVFGEGRLNELMGYLFNRPTWFDLVANLDIDDWLNECGSTTVGGVDNDLSTSIGSCAVTGVSGGTGVDGEGKGGDDTGVGLENKVPWTLDRSGVAFNNGDDVKDGLIPPPTDPDLSTSKGSDTAKYHHLGHPSPLLLKSPWCGATESLSGFRGEVGGEIPRRVWTTIHSAGNVEGTVIVFDGGGGDAGGDEGREGGGTSFEPGSYSYELVGGDVRGRT